MPQSTIPVELTEHILSFLDPSTPHDTESLRSLSQVNHEFCHLSQKIIFHTVVLQRPLKIRGHDGSVSRLSYAKNFHNLLTGVTKRRSDNPLRISGRPHHSIATYVRRLEIRDDRLMTFYSAAKSWVMSDPSAVYLPPLLYPSMTPLHHNDKANFNPEEDDRRSTIATLGKRSHGLLPNLEEVCIVGNPRGLGLPWSVFRDDMRDALVLRLGMGLLRVLELESCSKVPFELLGGSVGLEVLRLKNVAFTPFLDALSDTVTSPQRKEEPRRAKLRVLSFEMGGSFYRPRRSFLGWLARNKDAFDLSGLTDLRIQTRGCDSYETDGGVIVEEMGSMVGVEEIAHVVERTRDSLKLLHISDPRLDRWLFDSSPFREPSKLFEWAPHLNSITLGLYGNPHETTSEETDIRLLRRVNNAIGALEGLERDKPLVVELRFTFGIFIVLERVMSAWEELEQTIRLVESGVKPAMHIHIAIEQGSI